ncbi:sensor histidine kinase [Haliscomenobacter sp.]|uniref:sensor histidine kinase n=1 Tax=Haliscomenobacter sp. TaxID=2717303 RepID=UPI0035930CFD
MKNAQLIYHTPLFILAVTLFSMGSISRVLAANPPDGTLLNPKQIALLKPYLESTQWLRDSLHSIYKEDNFFDPLRQLNEQDLQNFSTNLNVPQHWRGFWKNTTRGNAIDVFSSHIFFQNSLHRVVFSADFSHTLICFVITPDLESKVWVFSGKSSNSTFNTARAFELTTNKFEINNSFFIQKNNQTPFPPALNGKYVEVNNQVLQKNRVVAEILNSSVNALDRNWNIESRGETFIDQRRGYYILAADAKTGTMAYFLFRKISLYENDWELRLYTEPNTIGLTAAVYVLGQRFAKLNQTGLDYRWLLLPILALILGYWLYRRRLQQVQKQQFRTHLALNGLRAQLNPHFLFNSLASIQDLVNEDNKAGANRYFDEIARLLRYVVDSSKYAYMPLTQELEALEKYCSLEALRTPFQYSFVLSPDIDQNNTEIPTMLLQPFVENAILHGLRPGTDPKELKISIWPESDNRIGISILDNGIGIDEAQRRGQKLQDTREHQGLATTRQRIDLLNEGKKEKITLKIIDCSHLKPGQTGTLVQLSIPL